MDKSLKNLEKTKAVIYKNGKVEKKEEIIVKDEKLEIDINNTIKRSLSGITDSLKEFITGYMLGEDLIEEITDIKAIKIDDYKIEVEVNPKKLENEVDEINLPSDASGGLRRIIKTINPIKSDLIINKDEILENMEKLRENAKIWQATGGTHVAAIVYQNQMIVKEDVSRHVAVDKVIGAGAYAGFDFSNSYIIYSGRMPADMVIKLVRVGIPILISNAAPMESGIKVANKGNITLVGFVRGNRFNIYTNSERIKF